MDFADLLAQRLVSDNPLGPSERAVEANAAIIREFLTNPPKHTWWGAGEPGCPSEIKAGNGEIHTLLCKVCGASGAKKGFCLPIPQEPRP